MLSRWCSPYRGSWGHTAVTGIIECGRRTPTRTRSQRECQREQGPQDGLLVLLGALIVPQGALLVAPQRVLLGPVDARLVSQDTQLVSLGALLE